MEHAHLKGGGTLRNRSADPAEADDPQRRSADVAPQEIRIGPSAPPGSGPDRYSTSLSSAQAGPGKRREARIFKARLFCLRCAVAVAQLVEPRVVVPVVGGSSPLRHLTAGSPAAFAAMTTSGGFRCRCNRLGAAPAQVGRGDLPQRFV